MIVIAVSYKVKSGRREEALGAAKICAGTTRREAGNIDYTFYAGIDSPDTFFPLRAVGRPEGSGLAYEIGAPRRVPEGARRFDRRASGDQEIRSL